MCTGATIDGMFRESTFERVTSEQTPGGRETRHHDSDDQERAQGTLEGAGSWQRAKAGGGEVSALWNPNTRDQILAPSFTSAVTLGLF